MFNKFNNRPQHTHTHTHTHTLTSTHIRLLDMRHPHVWYLNYK